jgi:hypothetical protein
MMVVVIQDQELDHDHVRLIFFLCLSLNTFNIENPSGSRSRSPKDRDTRRYPPRDDTNGDNTGNSYPRRPRYNEGKS